MELSTAATSYWRPMGFEPLAGGKDVTAFAIYEEGGAELNGAVAAWLKMVGEAYEVSSDCGPSKKSFTDPRA